MVGNSSTDPTMDIGIRARSTDTSNSSPTRWFSLFRNASLASTLIGGGSSPAKMPRGVSGSPFAHVNTAAPGTFSKTSEDDFSSSLMEFSVVLRSDQLSMESNPSSSTCSPSLMVT